MELLKGNKNNGRIGGKSGIIRLVEANHRASGAVTASLLEDETFFGCYRKQMLLKQVKEVRKYIFERIEYLEVIRKEPETVIDRTDDLIFLQTLGFYEFELPRDAVTKIYLQKPYKTTVQFNNLPAEIIWDGNKEFYRNFFLSV